MPLDVLIFPVLLMVLRVKEKPPRLVGFSFEGCKLFMCLEQVVL